MTETLDELKAIRDSAPEGATHVEIFTGSKQKPYFYKRELKQWCHRFIYDWWDAGNGQWLNSSHPSGDMRSLDDIKARIELMEELKKAKAEAFLEVGEKLHYEYEGPMTGIDIESFFDDVAEELLK